MNRIRTLSPAVFAILALVFALSPAVIAQKKDSQSANVKIKNFGQMDERFFRGARPKAEDLQALAALGVTTIIDLTDNSREYEQPAVEAAGLKYINIPMVDKSYPSLDQVNEFLKVVNNPETGKFFVHCAGGRHRTGVMGAVYRFNHYNWNYDQVYAEMKKYDFYTRWGHGEMKKFVKDYADNFPTKQTVTTVITGTN
jgi:protein tyrosine/serine phosphatase